MSDNLSLLQQQKTVANALATSGSAGAKRTLSWDQVAAKRLRENAQLKKCGPEITDGCVGPEGDTMRGELKKYLLKHDEKKKEYPMGATFYSNLVSKYTKLSKASAIPSAGSASASGQDVIRSSMMRAMLAWQAHPPNREAMESFLASEPKDLGAKEVAGVINCFKSLKPTVANPKTLDVCMSFMDYMAEHLKETWPSKIASASKSIDNALLQAWDAARKVDNDKDLFVSTHKKKLDMIFPADSLKALQEEKRDWGNVRVQLEEINQLSVGKALFGESLQILRGGALAKLVDDAVAAFMADAAEISQASVKAFIAKTTQDALALPGVEQLPDRRKIKVSYRAVPWVPVVKACGPEIKQKTWTAIKTLLVEHQRIPAVLCEDELCPPGKQYPLAAGRAVNKDVIEPLTLVRQKANAILAASEMKDSVSVKALLDKHEAGFAQKDPSFGYVELAFWGHMGQDSGAVILEAKFFASISSSTVELSIADSLSNVRNLTMGKLFAFCPQSTQENIRAGINALANLEMMEDPAIGNSPSAFLLKLKNAMKWFCAHGGKRGEEAIKKLYGDVMKCKNDVTKMDDAVLDKMFHFEFCLSQPQAKAVRDICSKMANDSKRSKVKSSAAAVASASAPSKSQAAGDSAASEQYKSALAMFDDE